MYWIRVLSATSPPTPPIPKAASTPARPASTNSARRAEHVKEVVSGTTAKTRNASATSQVTDASVARTSAAASGAEEPSGAVSNAAPKGSIAEAPTATPASLAVDIAPTTTPKEVDVSPPPAEEPDPGLVMKYAVDPQFPSPVIYRLRRGSVQVQFEVDPSGRVQAANVVQSTNSALNAAAIEAVRQWQFKPTPKAHTAQVDLTFDLDASRRVKVVVAPNQQ